jgi:anti-anti-sigma regulatory factor
LKETGGIFAFHSLSPMVQEVFKISGFSTLFTVYPSETEAISTLKAFVPQ